MRTVKRLCSMVLACAALLFAGYWGVSVLRCEYWTHKHKEEFKGLHIEHTMFGPSDYVRILEYTDTTAKVYYVGRGHGGNVVYYCRANSDSQWEFARWETIWSSSGSASGFIWPYIR